MKQNKPTAHSGLKDFLYNTNDVLITAVILIAALIIIGWRVNVIMAYPKHMTSGSVKTTTEVKKDAAKSSSSSSSASADKKSESSSNSKDSGSSAVKAEYKNGRLVKTITINIATGSLNSAMSQLKAFGIYETNHEFKVYCHREGRKASALKAGSHTLKKGWTKGKIARALTN